MIEIKAEGQIIVIMKDKRVIAFENRTEYDIWVLSVKAEEISSLYADGKIFYESIQAGKELMAHMQTFDTYDLKDWGINTELIE